jgi:hypothetical protein
LALVDIANKKDHTQTQAASRPNFKNQPKDKNIKRNTKTGPRDIKTQLKYAVPVSGYKLK